MYVIEIILGIFAIFSFVVFWILIISTIRCLNATRRKNKILKEKLEVEKHKIELDLKNIEYTIYKNNQGNN